MGTSPYYRFRDVVSLEVTPSFAPGYSFGCAFVQLGSERSDGMDTSKSTLTPQHPTRTPTRTPTPTPTPTDAIMTAVWAFGVGPNTTQIGAWHSTDLLHWESGPGLQLDGFGHVATDYQAFNNNVHRGREAGSHVMAIELGKPSDITGTPFTSVFATHAGEDLSTGWVFLDPHKHVYPPILPAHAYMGACPTIRYVAADDFYYLLTLHAEKNPVRRAGYGEYLVRSKDLITWETSAANPILDWQGEVRQDKGATPRAARWNYWTNFTSEMEEYIANATDINNSDVTPFPFQLCPALPWLSARLPAFVRPGTHSRLNSRLSAPD